MWQHVHNHGWDRLGLSVPCHPGDATLLEQATTRAPAWWYALWGRCFHLLGHIKDPSSLHHESGIQDKELGEDTYYQFQCLEKHVLLIFKGSARLEILVPKKASLLAEKKARMLLKFRLQFPPHPFSFIVSQDHQESKSGLWILIIRKRQGCCYTMQKRICWIHRSFS